MQDCALHSLQESGLVPNIVVEPKYNTGLHSPTVITYSTFSNQTVKMAMNPPTFFNRHLHHHHHPSSYFSKNQALSHTFSHSHQSMIITLIQKHHQHQNSLQPCKSSQPFLGYLNLYLFLHFFCSFAPPPFLGSDQWDLSLRHLAKMGSSVPSTRVASRTLFAGERTALLHHHHHRLQTLPILTTFLQWLVSPVEKDFFVAF